MDISLSQLAYYLIIPLIAWVCKVLVINRIEALERKVETMVNETQVRQILCDKIDPVQADVKEIKQDLKQLFTLAISQKKSDDETNE